MPEKRTYFEQATLPHLDAAYNLARWLMRNEQDAEDVVQEAYMRAFKYFDSFRGTDSRSWLLAIVRHACFTWKQQAFFEHSDQRCFPHVRWSNVAYLLSILRVDITRSAC